jgi:hypothetical protein
MGHIMSAIVLKGSYNRQEAEQFELLGIDLGFDLTLFHINPYYTAYWQVRLNTSGLLKINDTTLVPFPHEYVVCELISRITKDKTREYAIISTEYHGGVGGQFANVYRGHEVVNESIKTINQALKQLKVIPEAFMDEFDTVGLGAYRTSPEYLWKYDDLADGLGV